MSTWRVFAERLQTVDFQASPRVFQPIRFNKNYALKAIRTWFVFHGSPSFSSLQFRIYNDKNGKPENLLFTFDKSWVLSNITSRAYANKEIYFDSTLPFDVKDNETYHLVPWFNAYTGIETSHAAWVRSIPDPIFTNFTLSTWNRQVAPFKIGFVGAPI